MKSLKIVFANRNFANAKGLLHHKIVQFILAAACLFLFAITPVGAQDSAFKAAPYKVGVYTYAGAGTVNTWYIETSKELIVIDLQRDLIHANEALLKIKSLKKLVVAILLTHGHPDHFAGLEMFHKEYPKAAIYASEMTYQTIKNDPNGYMAFMKKIPGNENFNPQTVPLPDKLFKNNATLQLNGVTIETKELGEGETTGATGYYLPATKELFAGDIIQYQMHGFFLEAHTLQWVEIVKLLKTNFPKAKIIHPGHGVSGGTDLLIAGQLEYMDYFISLVRKSLGDNGNVPLTTEQINTLSADVKKRFPGYERSAGQPNMVELSVEGVSKELLKR